MVALRRHGAEVAKLRLFEIKISRLCNGHHNYNSAELLTEACLIRSTLHTLCTFYFYPFISDRQAIRALQVVRFILP